MRQHGRFEASARYLAFVVAALSVLHLLVHFGVGALVVTTDWSRLGCFDGTEPACGEPTDSGLSAVRASTWLLASIAVVAAVTAFVLALRLRRVAHLAPVLLLCAASVVLVQVLWWRA